jgi:hypothetical protein
MSESTKQKMTNTILELDAILRSRVKQRNETTRRIRLALRLNQHARLALLRSDYIQQCNDITHLNDQVRHTTEQYVTLFGK